MDNERLTSFIVLGVVGATALVSFVILGTNDNRVTGNPVIPSETANPDCLTSCDSGFNLCLHRAQKNNRPERKCYASRDKCYLKCENY